MKFKKISGFMVPLYDSFYADIVNFVVSFFKYIF